MPARYRLSKWYSSRRIRTTSRLFRRGAHRGRPRGTRPKDNKCWANSLPFSPFLVESEPIGIATRRAPRMGAPTNRRNLFPFNQTSKMFQVAGICSLPYSWRIQMIVPPISILRANTLAPTAAGCFFPFSEAPGRMFPAKNRNTIENVDI